MFGMGLEVALVVGVLPLAIYMSMRLIHKGPRCHSRLTRRD